SNTGFSATCLARAGACWCSLARSARGLPAGDAGIRARFSRVGTLGNLRQAVDVYSVCRDAVIRTENTPKVGAAATHPLLAAHCATNGSISWMARRRDGISTVPSLTLRMSFWANCPVQVSYEQV